MKKRQRAKLIKDMKKFLESGSMDIQKTPIRKRSEIQSLFQEFTKQKKVKSEEDVKDVIFEFITFLDLAGFRIVSEFDFIIMPYDYFKFHYMPYTTDAIYDDDFLMFPPPLKHQK